MMNVWKNQRPLKGKSSSRLIFTRERKADQKIYYSFLVRLTTQKGGSQRQVFFLAALSAITKLLEIFTLRSQVSISAPP